MQSSVIICPESSHSGIEGKVQRVFPLHFSKTNRQQPQPMEITHNTSGLLPQQTFEPHRHHISSLLSFISEAEEALLINFSADCKYFISLWVVICLSVLFSNGHFTENMLFWFFKQAEKNNLLWEWKRAKVAFIATQPPSSHTTFLEHAFSQMFASLFSSRSWSWVTRALRKNAELSLS